MNKYKFEYYLQKTYSKNTNMNIILDSLSHEYEYKILFVKSIHKYNPIFKYIWIFDKKIQSPGYSYLPV